MSRLAEDLKRIVGVKELERRLDEALRKSDIPGQRGIAYMVGGAVAAANGTPGETTASDAKAKAEEIAEDTLSDAAEDLFESSGDKLPEDPTEGGLLQGALDGVHDIMCLLDGTCGPELSEDTALTAGALNGITGLKDLLEGVDMQLRLDGNYRVPEGWTDQNTPASDGTWTAGLYWWMDSSGLIGADSFGNGFDQLLDDLSANAALIGATVIPRSVGPGPEYEDQGPAIAENRIRVWLNYIGGSSQIFEYNVDYMQRTCDDSEAISAGFTCSMTAPTSDRYDPTGYFILSKQLDGIWRGSLYDSEVPMYLRGSQSTVNFTFENSTRYGKIMAANNGGSIIFETNEGGDPVGIARVYRANKTLQAVIESTDVPKWLP